MERSEGVRDAAWRTASYSGTEGECVEVAPLPGVTAVRDTKDRDGGTLQFPTVAWRAFTANLV
ncbi:protein of unknown function [Amycolatopsis marina]|uniref:DUF397 domain-containing protein n=1 Tax=Amycolatopsis marina TaxID=490629 RepID=A0A1I1A9L7_9PSEU|nr:DUF397 domain-containing protein [Amycolatopsis marina]SFB33083.1 protein of unknown function [Amycolatopsis marina]